jgi:hypothetical protein
MSDALDFAGALASLALPWIAGALVVRALWRARPDAPSMPLVIGYGYVAGAFVATMSMRLLSIAGIRWSAPTFAGAIVIVALAAAWLGRRIAAMPATGPGLRSELAAAPPAMRVLFGIAFALIAVRLAGIAVEVAVSPLRAYDAWGHWATKAIVWHDHGGIVPFVRGEVWLTASSKVYTDSNPSHPSAIPLLQAWTATFLTGWSESLINLPWIAIAAALGFAFYAQARGVGASAPFAMIATWLLLSLPVLNLHVASAGTADVFLGAIFGMAAMATWRWTLTRDAPMAWLAAIAAAFALYVKAEGVLWIATLVPAIVVALHRRAGFALAGAAVLAAGGYLAFGPDSLPLMGYALRTRPINVLPSLRDHLLVFDNWHLGWYAVAAIAAWRWRALLSPRIAPMTFTMLAGLALIVVVYFFTPAALGVANETLVNRMPLHFAPAAAFYALVLVVEGRERPGVQPSRQATNAAEA